MLFGFIIKGTILLIIYKPKHSLNIAYLDIQALYREHLQHTGMILKISNM